MNLLKRSIQRNGKGKLSDKTKKKILSVIFAGIMAGSSAGVMAGCELPEGFQGLVDGLKTVTVTDPNGKKVTITVGKVNKTLENLPEMLKMAADPSYVNENVEGQEVVESTSLMSFVIKHEMMHSLGFKDLYDSKYFNKTIMFYAFSSFTNIGDYTDFDKKNIKQDIKYKKVAIYILPHFFA